MNSNDHLIQRRLFTIGALGSLITPQLRAQAADEYPAMPIRLVVPAPPGAGGADQLARLFARYASASLKQRVVVENKPGASGQIGTQYALSQPPDGYTLVMGWPSTLLLAHRERPPYRLSDLDPVASIARVQTVLVARGDIPVRTYAELIAWAPKQPDFTFGDYGSNTFSRISNTVIEKSAGFKGVHVSYKGVAPLAQALLAGEVTAGLLDMGTAIPQANSGRIRILGITGRNRSPRLPAVPTFQELGLDMISDDQVIGLFAPAGTPLARREVIYRATMDMVASLQKLGADAPDTGYDIAAGSPTELGKQVAALSENIERMLKMTGIRLE